MIKNNKTSLKERFLRFNRPFYWNLGPIKVRADKEQPVHYFPIDKQQ
ncbi:hypothetical protein [Flagellimonas sp. GZD32]